MDTATTSSGARAARRWWTVPNVLSMVRLVGVPVFLGLVLTHHDLAALAVLAVSGISDYLDGKIARRYGLVTTVGQLLDPLADRLYILSTLAGLGIRGVIPWWLVAVLLLRDVLIAALAVVVRVRDLPRPAVHFVGKSATFNLLYAFPLLLLGAGTGPVALVGLVIGWAFAWWGTALYWVAGGIYSIEVWRMAGAHRAPQEVTA